MSILDAIIETEICFCSTVGARIRASSNSVRVSDERISERDAYN
jgi:hypothetical protein